MKYGTVFKWNKNKMGSMFYLQFEYDSGIQMIGQFEYQRLKSPDFECFQCSGVRYLVDHIVFNNTNFKFEVKKLPICREFSYQKLVMSNELLYNNCPSWKASFDFSDHLNTRRNPAFEWSKHVQLLNV